MGEDINKAFIQVKSSSSGEQQRNELLGIVITHEFTLPGSNHVGIHPQGMFHSWTPAQAQLALTRTHFFQNLGVLLSNIWGAEKEDEKRGN